MEDKDTTCQSVTTSDLLMAFQLKFPHTMARLREKQWKITAKLDKSTVNNTEALRNNQSYSDADYNDDWNQVVFNKVVFNKK